MKVTMTVVEGTPDEILAAMPHLRNASHADVAAGEKHVAPSPVATMPVAKSPESDDKDEEVPYVSTRVARRVLNRIKLHGLQKDVLVALDKAHPETMLASELQEETGYTPAQFAGLMGAWGRRVTHTPGYGPDEYFFIQHWDHDAGCMRYGLPESVREALRQEGIV